MKSNSKPHKTLLFIFFIFAFFNKGNSQIYINEFMASNSTTIADEAGEFDDWVEVYNAGSSPVDLAGYYWTDDLTIPTLSQIPSTNPSLTTVPAGGFLLFWFDKDTEQGANHVNTKLSAAGEDLALFAPDGSTLIDSYSFGVQLVDVSEGRVPDGGSTFDFYGESTPESSNNTNAGPTQVALPTVNISGGHHSNSVTISLHTTTAGATIYYTLDGSVPDADSQEYTNPITISETTSLRARGILESIIPSPILTETYLIDIEHIFPIVSLSGNPDDFFGENGIIPNYSENIEIPVNIEYFDTDGSLGFNQVIGVEVSGTASASFDQKSLALKAKGSFGDATFSHPLFPNQDRDSYRSLILRNSGNDWSLTFFRDALVTSLGRDVSDVGDIIETPRLYGMDYRPVITYLNGEYYGIYNMRERADTRYIKTHFGLEEEEIDFIENKDVVKEGEVVAWEELQEELENTDYSVEANYENLAEQVDVDDYIDYVVLQLYADNQDWPGNNNRRFRSLAPDGKWRWLLYDLDFSFGIFTDAGWNEGSAEDNSLDRLLNPSSFSHPNPEWSARLFNNLLESDIWRTKFINRMADQINILYQPERINARIDAYYNNLLPEREQSQELWGNFWGHYEDKELLKLFSNNRIPYVYEHFEEAFDEIDGTAEITIDATSGGSVDFSTLHLNEDDVSWTGTYFEGVPIPVVAVPHPGYVFSHWSGDLSGNENSESITLSGDADIMAHFVLGSTSTAGIIINEINYNSGEIINSGDWVEFHNPTNEAVDISGWYFQDEEGAYFIFPNNTILEAGDFLVLVEDFETEFNVYYPNVENVIGDFGDASIFDNIKISNGGELLSLFNANGVLIDEVDYNDNAPWVSTPDGFGPTLQLANPFLDNILSTNWAGWEPTPGATNAGGNLMSQSINFPSLSDKFTNNLPFQISATASSNLPVSFTIVSGPAQINGNAIALTGQTGTVTVQAFQNGDISFNPATPVNQSFEVLEVPLLDQSINFPIISDKFTDDLPFQISASASSDLEVNFTIISGPATVNNNTITLSGEAGTVTVQASQNGNEIYNSATTITQSFEVLEVPLLDQNIDFPSIFDKYTDDLPFQISASASSDLEVSFTILSGPAIVNNNIITLSGEIGTVTLQASQTGNGIYNPAENVQQSFEVIEPPLTEYCIPVSNSAQLEWIGGVNLAGTNNPSGPSNYSDFTNLIIDLEQEETYPIILTTRYSYFSFLENWKIWIDFNQNFEFEANEVVFFSSLSPPPHGSLIASLSGNIEIPLNAELGETRMRVSMARNEFATPCGNINYGEYEDYTINILPTNGVINNPIKNIVSVPNEVESQFNEGNELDLFSNNSKETELLLFPNPTSDMIFISAPDLSGSEVKIELLNGNGVRLNKMEYKRLPYSPVAFSVWDLESGVYFICLFGEDGNVEVKRFVVGG